ncbi:MAG: serine/threonine protein kinase [Anaerolineae bacterium]|nr:serine/threonine protein kinase [Anaerolineae bacterium]
MEHNLIGRIIGGYLLLEQLGAGGMASVYRARDVSNNQQYAVKLLPFHMAANDTLRHRFQREAEMAARLTHPHILPLYTFGEQDGAPYIVMKFVDGGTLNALIEQGPLGLRMIARVLAQVASALDYAHEQGVIHRDLKPENILFDTQGQAYLADFGIARMREASSTLTGTGGFIGTAAYASPEQCRGEELTPVSDIYSLGVVLYEMLTSVKPYDGQNALAIMHQHMTEPIPNPLKYRADLPVTINDVMRKAMAKLPYIRYQTAAAMSEALNNTLRRELGTSPLAEKAPPIGPDPVFDKAPDAYTAPPPIPDELTQDIAPSRPRPPWKDDDPPMPDTQQFLASVRVSHPGAAESPTPARNAHTSRATESDPVENANLYIALLIIVTVLAIAAIGITLVIR